MRLALEGYTGGIQIGGIRLPNLRYADDIILIAGCRSELQDLVDRVQSASTEMGLRINVKKTAAMNLNTSEEPEISIYKKRIPIMKSFKSLGVILSSEAPGVEEFQAKLNQGYVKLAVLKSVLKRKIVPARLKVKLIQALMVPVVSYGCEAWSLSKDECCKLKAFETKAYRRALGIHYGERVTNREVFARAGCEALLETQVRKRKLRYFGHFVRHDSLENTIMPGMMGGQKRKNGQRRQWVDDIFNRVSTTHSVRPTPNGRIPKALIRSIPEPVALARERDGWRSAVHNFTNPAPRGG